jgi:acetyl esterase
MPNPDNTKWIGMVLGRELAPGPPMQSVDEIPGRRSFWDAEAMQPLAPPRLAATHEVELRDGLRGELYVPDGRGPFPCVLYLHGGWFVMWSAAHVRRITTRIAERGFLVLNLDYRLAPEDPFPAAVDDAAFAARWLAEHAAEYGGDGDRIVVAGDSVGATLAATTILSAGDVRFAGALLLYGVFDLPGVIAEPLTNAGLAEISTLAYLGVGFTKLWREPLVSPYYADVSGFPPCYVSCGDEDSLLSQSLAMARKLHLANVPLTVSVVQGADHGFVYLEHILAGATPEVERILDWLDATA